MPKEKKEESMISIQLLQQINEAWKGYSLNLPTLLSQYRVDNPELSLLTDEFTDDACQQGLFLQDTSGLAAHLLGLHFIECWHQGKLLQQYQQILWLPFAKLLKLPVKPTIDRTGSLTQLGTLTNPAFQLNDASTLVIITGIDYQLNEKFIDSDFAVCAQLWMQHIQNLPRLAIGNYKPAFFSDFNTTTPITLSPIFLNLHYEKIDSYNDEQYIAFPGDLLVKEITAHTRRAFRFNQDTPEGVFSISNATVRNYMIGEIDIVPELQENVDHLQPLLTVQDVIQILVGQPPAKLGDKGLSVLDTPAKWYYAALSAEKVHADAPQKKFFLYQIAGHIIVRRMTQDSMHYIIDLGRVDNYAIKSIKLGAEQNNDAIKFILQHVALRDDFDKLNHKEIVVALNQARRAWMSQETEKRNMQLQNENKIAPKEPVKLSKESEKIFKNICSTFRKDFNDAELKEGIKTLSKEDQDASYQTIQRNINRFFQTGVASHVVCEKIVNILNGNPVNKKFNMLILMLAANLLAESARNTRTFFAPFAMLSLTLTNTGSWASFVALPERVKIDIANANWQQLILADCMDALGGMHPMAHNGSFLQINPTYNIHLREANHGISWPELKTQLLYAKWLAGMIDFTGIGIQIKEAHIAFSKPLNYRLLTENDQAFMMCDLELLLRIETSYCITTGNNNILNLMEKPFQRATHLFAHPRQISVINCGNQGEFGYFLCMPRRVGQSSENHFIHLTAEQTLMIAVKYDAVGDDTNALRLYNYLCQRHPKCIIFRFSRLQCLVMHPDLMQNKTLRQHAQHDCNFLEKLKIDSVLGQQISYVSAIYSLRATTEDPRLKLVPSIDAINIFLAAIDKAKRALGEFSRYDEEMSMLQLTIASAYQLMFERVEPELINPPQTLLYSAIVAQEQSIKHLVAYALTLHRTTSTIKRMNTAFDFIMRTLDLRAIALSGQPKSQRIKHTTIAHDIPNALNLLEQIVLSIVNDFKPHMKNQQAPLKRAKKLANKTKGKARFKKVFVSGITDLQSTEIQVKKIVEEGTYALLIKSTSQVPTSIIQGWGQFHGLKIEPVNDSTFGPCLKIELNPSWTSRAHYQPMPRPYSFLRIKYQFAEASPEDEYFSAFKYIFKQCLEQIKDWRINSVEVKKISYHTIGNITLLPSVHLIKSDAQQHVVVEIPNGVPINIVLAWLRSHNFAYYWVNEENLGRCIYVPQINIDTLNPLYNLATSNGDIIFPFIKQALLTTASVDIEPSYEPMKLNESYKAVLPYKNTKAEIELLEQKYVSHIYWYEDNEMLRILQGSMAQRNNQTRDGRTVDIRGPLDNISSYNLISALTDWDRQPGVLLIPFNLGQLHWIGLLLEYDAARHLIRADFYDSLGEEVPDYLNFMLISMTQDYDPARTFSKIEENLIRQNNGSDCGPCTIANLLTSIGFPEPPNMTTINRRLEHLNLLEAIGGDFYPDFYQRQCNNQSSFLSLKNNQQVYSASQFDEKTHIGTKEYKALLCLARAILSLSDSWPQDIINALSPDASSPSEEHAVQLDRLRTTFNPGINDQSIIAIITRLFCIDAATENLAGASLKIDYNYLAILYSFLLLDIKHIDADLQVLDFVQPQTVGDTAGFQLVKDNPILAPRVPEQPLVLDTHSAILPFTPGT